MILSVSQKASVLEGLTMSRESSSQSESKGDPQSTPTFSSLSTTPTGLNTFSGLTTRRPELRDLDENSGPPTFSHSNTVTGLDTFSETDTQVPQTFSATSTNQAQTFSSENTLPSDRPSTSNFQSPAETALPAPKTTTQSQGPLDSHLNLTLIEEIGKGGMGVVYRAYQKNLEREIAVKIPVQNPKIQRRFTSEALSNGFLEHPNIVPIYDLNLDQSKQLMAMKLVRGKSFREVLLELRPHEELESKDSQEHKALSECLEILLKACDGIAYAHAEGVAHLDIKPENIMVGAFGEVLIMDWGIACDFAWDDSKRASQRPKGIPKSQMLPDKPFGTLSYAAPELADGRIDDIGPKTDLFLLGATLHEILTGRPPYQCKTIMALLAMASEVPDPSFSESVPAPLQRICRKAMNSNPDSRYQDVKAFQVDLQDYLKLAEKMKISQSLSDGARLTMVNGALHGAAQDLDIHRIYLEHADCVSRFKQALEIWPENASAKAGLKAAILRFGEVAIIGGDLGLARAQVTELDERDKDRREFEKRLRAEERANQGELRNLKRRGMLIWVIAGSIVLLTLAALIALLGGMK